MSTLPDTFENIEGFPAPDMNFVTPRTLKRNNAFLEPEPEENDPKRQKIVDQKILDTLVLEDDEETLQPTLILDQGDFSEVIVGIEATNAKTEAETTNVNEAEATNTKAEIIVIQETPPVIEELSWPEKIMADNMKKSIENCNRYAERFSLLAGSTPAEIHNLFFNVKNEPSMFSYALKIAGTHFGDDNEYGNPGQHILTWWKRGKTAEPLPEDAE